MTNWSADIWLAGASASDLKMRLKLDLNLLVRQDIVRPVASGSAIGRRRNGTYPSAVIKVGRAR